MIHRDDATNATSGQADPLLVTATIVVLGALLTAGAIVFAFFKS